MAGRLIGAQDLRNRLAAIQQVFPEVGGAWADLAVGLMQKKIYSPSGKLRSTIRGEYDDRGARVYADWRVTFIDKGTREHGPKRAPAMRFYGYGSAAGRTIFTKHVRGVRKRPFISSSARQARKDTPYANELLRLWRQSGGHSEKYVLGGKGAAKRRAAYRRAHAR